MTAREHNKLLSIFFFIQGGIQLLAGIFIVVVYGILGGSMLAAGNTEQAGHLRRDASEQQSTRKPTK